MGPAFFVSRMIDGGDVMESTSQVSFNLSVSEAGPGCEDANHRRNKRYSRVRRGMPLARGSTSLPR
jgi:hypothetical protein